MSEIPGVAPDGSPVEVFKRLPPREQPAVVEALRSPPATVLELGCGAGRVTTALVDLGYVVVAVDQSAAMVAATTEAAPDAVGVVADIEVLELGRRFDVVLLASHLVNVDDDALRTAFLRSCAAHVKPDGVVVAQRYDPGWLREAHDATSSGDGFTFDLTDVTCDGEHFSATVTYTAEDGSGRWPQPFRARVLDDDDIARECAAAGLKLDAWVLAGDFKEWFSAKPAAAPAAAPATDPATGADEAVAP